MSLVFSIQIENPPCHAVPCDVIQGLESCPVSCFRAFERQAASRQKQTINAGGTKHQTNHCDVGMLHLHYQAAVVATKKGEASPLWTHCPGGKTNGLRAHDDRVPIQVSLNMNGLAASPGASLQQSPFSACCKGQVHRQHHSWPT